MRDVPRTPASTLDRARRIAMDNGVHYAFTGNVHDSKGGSTYCPAASTRSGNSWRGAATVSAAGPAELL